MFDDPKADVAASPPGRLGLIQLVVYQVDRRQIVSPRLREDNNVFMLTFIMSATRRSGTWHGVFASGFFLNCACAYKRLLRFRCERFLSLSMLSVLKKNAAGFDRILMNFPSGWILPMRLPYPPILSAGLRCRHEIVNDLLLLLLSPCSDLSFV